MNLLSGALVLVQAVAIAPLDQRGSSPVGDRAAAMPVPEVAREVVALPSLPTIGKWMLNGRLEVANWLGMKVRGKQVREPINVIVVDRLAGSAEEATRRLVDGLKTVGYGVVGGHSSGYNAIIGGRVLGQLPAGEREAFADGPPNQGSDHGRFFGPFPLERGFLFTGAFSLEVVSRQVAGHLYGSFDHARDDLATRLDEATAYHVAGYVGVENAIVGNPVFTTGDHDGVAVLLEASLQVR
ncbi:MAG: hypothetical protein ACHQQS_01170 [Thermoanaerobaculales bacterium]